jgi:hypothetical protein
MAHSRCPILTFGDWTTPWHTVGSSYYMRTLLGNSPAVTTLIDGPAKMWIQTFWLQGAHLITILSHLPAWPTELLEIITSTGQMLVLKSSGHKKATCWKTFNRASHLTQHNFMWWSTNYQMLNLHNNNRFSLDLRAQCARDSTHVRSVVFYIIPMNSKMTCHQLIWWTTTTTKRISTGPWQSAHRQSLDWTWTPKTAQLPGLSTLQNGLPGLLLTCLQLWVHPGEWRDQSSPAC